MILPLAASLLVAIAAAGESPVAGFGVATLADPAMVARLAGRFKAHGQPVFLLSAPSIGLQQGDLIRFPDRAVLIDGDVWQTLQAEGALDALRRNQGRVAQLRARARPEVWDERRRLVSDPRDRKGYALGASLLRSLEAAAGRLPDGRIQLSFERGDLVILAPRAFLDALRLAPAQESPSTSKPPSVHPLFVSAPPTRVFAGRPFLWHAWVVDSLGGPSGEIDVEIASTLPDGMRWDPGTRILSGSWSAGTWPLTAVAKAPGGRGDTLRLSIEARSNRLPALTGSVPPAWSGEPWSFHPVASDSDHPAESLAVRLAGAPPGASWNDATSRLDWIPPDSLADRDATFRLVATDPLGDSSEFVRTLRVGRRDQRVSTDGLAIRLPWDTLLARRGYEWSTAASRDAWQATGAILDSVTGSVGTVWDGTVLRVVPPAPGVHEVAFHFRVDGIPRRKDHAFPVRAERPPVWRSRTACLSLAVGDTVRYAPVAISPEGSEVAIAPVGALPPGATWNGTDLLVTPRKAGDIVVRLRATDEHGNATDQMVAWTVERANRRQWMLRQEVHAMAWPEEAQLTLGNGRVGLFVHDMTRTFHWSGRIEQDWPMFYVGADVLRSPANRLWFDIGLVFRNPSPGVFTGGGMGRAEAAFRQVAPLPLDIEGSILGWVHHGILSVDTSEVRESVVGDSADPGASEAAESYTAVKEQILEDARARRNVVLLTRLETWYRLHPRFQAGPVLWREDRPNPATWRQYVGAGVRGEFTLGPVSVRPALRTGWGSGDAGWGAWGDIQIGSPSTRVRR